MTTELTFAGRTFRCTDETAARLSDPEPMIPYLEGIQEGDVFLDVGAGCGLYTLRAMAMGAKVYACEPYVDDRYRLLRNLELNGWDWTKALEGRCAVDTSVLFDGGVYPTDLANDVWGQHYPMPDAIAVRTVEDLKIGRVDWCKVDVEGAELGMLQGARKTLERWHPRLLIEDHDIVPETPCEITRYANSIQSGKRMRELLSSLGYEMTEIRWGCGRKFLVAR